MTTKKTGEDEEEGILTPKNAAEMEFDDTDLEEAPETAEEE